MEVRETVTIKKLAAYSMVSEKTIMSQIALLKKMLEDLD